MFNTWQLQTFETDLQQRLFRCNDKHHIAMATPSKWLQVDDVVKLLIQLVKLYVV